MLQEAYDAGARVFGENKVQEIMDKYDQLPSDIPVSYTHLDVWCERVYSPWLDLDKLMREQNIPLFALESQDPIRDFDFLCITLGYEMCYTCLLYTSRCV